MSSDQKNIFIDRDGVLNTTLPPYVSQWNEFVWYPWTFRALRVLQQWNARIFVITNQSGIGRGYFSEETLLDIFKNMERRLDDAGLELTDIYYCPHHPDKGCDCRKPSPGMFVKAASEHNVVLEDSWFIGDHYTDIEAGNAVGAHTILVKSLRDGSEVRDHSMPAYVVGNLLEASELIVGEWRKAV